MRLQISQRHLIIRFAANHAKKILPKTFQQFEKQRNLPIHLVQANHYNAVCNSDSATAQTINYAEVLSTLQTYCLNQIKL